MNPSASPYWTQELPVLEAPDGAEAAAGGAGEGGNNTNNNNGTMMMSPPPPPAVPNQAQAPIHPGQMRPINAANGYAVSSDFVGNNNDGTMMAPSSSSPAGPMMMAGSMMIMMPDAAGHHHYDQHHREAQWPDSLAAAVNHMSMTTNNHHHHPSSPHSPPISSNQQMPHNPYSNQSIPVGQVVPSPYGGGGGGYHHHDHHNNHHEYSGAYYQYDHGHHNDGMGGDGQYYYDDDSSPNSYSRGSRGGHRHGSNHSQKQKPSLRSPALRSAYWRLKLSLLATTSGGASSASSGNVNNRQHPQDRTNNRNRNSNSNSNNNPFAAREMANPTQAEAWLAAIGAAESMAQKKDGKTNNGRMSKKKKNHQSGVHGHGHGRGSGRRDHDHRGSRGGSEDTAGDNGSIDNKLLAAGYLKHLFHQLSHDKAYWDGPPRFHPTIPNWDEEGIHQATLIVENMPGMSSMGSGGHYYDHGEEEEDPYMTPNNNRGKIGRSGGGNGSNRYSVFGDDDEDSSDDEENAYGSHGGQDYDGDITDDAKSTAHSGGSDTSSTGDLSEEEIVYHGGRHAATTNHRSKSKASAKANFDPTDTTQMATRRIVVRVLAALGDIHGVIGIDHSRAKPTPRWVRGASQYAFAFRSLTIGQELLDGQYAQMLQAEEEEDGAVGGDGKVNGGPSPPTPRTKDRLDKLKAALATDSEIIAVSLTSFARNRERYLNAAKSRIDFLQGRLLEDKESREQAFQGMGQDKWENNPTPRCTYSERRKKMERELLQAKEGSERVSKLESPAKKKAPMAKKYTEPKRSGSKAKIPEGVVVEV